MLLSMVFSIIYFRNEFTESTFNVILIFFKAMWPKDPKEFLESFQKVFKKINITNI